jgi:hypothetical protein
VKLRDVTTLAARDMLCCGDAGREGAANGSVARADVLGKWLRNVMRKGDNGRERTKREGVVKAKWPERDLLPGAQRSRFGRLRAPSFAG